MILTSHSYECMLNGVKERGRERGATEHTAEVRARRPDVADVES